MGIKNKAVEQNIIKGLVSVITVAVVAGLLFSFPLMLLWNGCLVGAIAGVNPVGWVQMWGIVILTGLQPTSVITMRKLLSTSVDFARVAPAPLRLAKLHARTTES